MFKKVLFKEYIVVLVLVTLVITGCAAAAPELMERQAMVEMPPAEADQSEMGGNFQVSSSVPQTERLVIKDANLTIVVNDPSQSMNQIAQMAEMLGGFVVSANLYFTRLDSGAEVPQASITIRVPSEQFDEALSQIRKESDRIPISQNINSQDVTSDYTDLQSRLRNLEAAEAQLASIMEEARRTEDVLSVYNELVQVREQIEIIKGQIQYYEQSAALSAISVELLANEAVQPLTIGGWQPGGVAKNAIQAMINTMKSLVNAFIWIVLYILPVLFVIFIIFFLPLFLLWRAWRRRASKKDHPADHSPAENSQE